MSEFFTRSMQLLRDKNPGNKKRFLKVVDTCNAFSPVTRLKYIFDGKRSFPYSSHEDILKAWAKMERQFGGAGLDEVFMMTTDDKEEFFSLSPMLDAFEGRGIDGIEFTFSTDKPLLKPDGYISFNECRELFIAAINSYEAYVAFIHDSDLEQLVTFGFVYRVMKEQLPKSEWKYIPTPDIVEKVPAALAERLSKLHSSDDFNRLEVPEAIYWFNYWNPYMVKNVGEDRIRKAPCAVVEKQDNGGYILIVQKENFDARNVEHLEKLAKVYDHFNLYELQRQHLF